VKRIENTLCDGRLICQACVASAAAIVYTKTGSYAGAIVGQVIFFLIAVVLALSARRTRAVLATA